MAIEGMGLRIEDREMLTLAAADMMLAAIFVYG
jgi:hypothetical protein